MLYIIIFNPAQTKYFLKNIILCTFLLTNYMFAWVHNKLMCICNDVIRILRIKSPHLHFPPYFFNWVLSPVISTFKKKKQSRGKQNMSCPSIKRYRSALTSILCGSQSGIINSCMTNTMRRIEWPFVFFKTFLPKLTVIWHTTRGREGWSPIPKSSTYWQAKW